MQQLASILLCIFLCSPLLTVSTGYPNSLSEHNNACISYIPSAISPNGDGVNDYFQLQYQCEPNLYSIRIYNERSELIFESTHIEQRWDGSIKGSPAPEGPYTWILSFHSAEGRQQTQRGQFMLIR